MNKQIPILALLALVLLIASIINLQKFPILSQIPQSTSTPLTLSSVIEIPTTDLQISQTSGIWKISNEKRPFYFDPSGLKFSNKENQFENSFKICVLVGQAETCTENLQMQPPINNGTKVTYSGNFETNQFLLTVDYIISNEHRILEWQNMNIKHELEIRSKLKLKVPTEEDVKLKIINKDINFQIQPKMITSTSTVN